MGNRLNRQPACRPRCLKKEESAWGPGEEHKWNPSPREGSVTNNVTRTVSLKDCKLLSIWGRSCHCSILLAVQSLQMYPYPWSGPFRDHGQRPWSQSPSEPQKTQEMKGFLGLERPFLDLVSQTPRPRGRGRPLFAELSGSTHRRHSHRKPRHFTSLDIKIHPVFSHRRPALKDFHRSLCGISCDFKGKLRGFRIASPTTVSYRWRSGGVWFESHASLRIFSRFEAIFGQKPLAASNFDTKPGSIYHSQQPMFKEGNTPSGCKKKETTTPSAGTWKTWDGSFWYIGRRPTGEIQKTKTNRRRNAQRKRNIFCTHRAFEGPFDDFLLGIFLPIWRLHCNSRTPHACGTLSSRVFQ